MAEKEPLSEGLPDGTATGPGEAPPDPEQGFIRELSQFFIIPSLIVLLCVGVFILFGMIASEKKGARDFLQELRSGSENDRWLAAFELSRLLTQEAPGKPDPRLLEEIIAALGREGAGDPRIRKYLIIALERLGDPSAGPAIVAALGDADPEVRLHAARAVASFNGLTGAVEPLAKLLSDDDVAIRKVAAYALGQTRDPAAVPILIVRLEDPLEDLRWNAALSLAVLGDASGREVIASMLDRAHLDRVAGISEDQKVSAMINGIQGAYLLRDRGLLENLRAIAKDDPDLRVREMARKAAEAIESERAN